MFASQAEAYACDVLGILFDQPREQSCDVSNASNRDGRLAGLRVKQ
jgi:hypothetical protein